MGCSESRAEPNAKNDNKPQQNVQPEPKPVEPECETKEGEIENTDVYVSPEEAEQYIINEVNMSEENAKKMVGKMDTNQEGNIYKKTLSDMCDMVNQMCTDLADKFRLIDTDNNGFVSTEEAEMFIHKNMRNIPEKTVKVIIKRFEREGSQGNVDYEGFVHFYAIISARINNLKSQFDALDVDSDGALSREELSDTLSQVCGLPSWQANLLMELYDVDNDGKINREEFNTMLTEVFESV